MKLLVRYTIAITLALLPLNTSTSSAHEVAANFPSAAVANINGHGRDKCRALGHSGYTAKVRGILGDGGGGAFNRGGFRSFNVTTCFKSKKQCQHFIRRIHHKIAQIERIRYAGCKSRV